MSSGSRSSGSSSSAGSQNPVYSPAKMSMTAGSMSAFREERPDQVVGPQRIPRRPIPAPVSGNESRGRNALRRSSTAQCSPRELPPSAEGRPRLILRIGSTVAMTSASLGNARSEIASCRRASEAAKNKAASPIRTRDSAERLTDRGHYDPEMETRAAAPWARPEDFTPVGPEQAFTPESHLKEYFLSPSGTSKDNANDNVPQCLRVGPERHEVVQAKAATVPKVKSGGGGGLQRRPATKDRLYSAPPKLSERHLLSSTPSHPAPGSEEQPRASLPVSAENTAPASDDSKDRRKTLPRLKTGLANVVAASSIQFSPVTYQAPTPTREDSPEIESPKLVRDAKANRNSADSMKDSAAAKVLSKGVGAVRTAVVKMSFARRASEANALQPDGMPSSPARPGSESSKGSGNSSRSRSRSGTTYQEPMRLAEYALNQPQAARKPEDEFTAREIAELSPASVECLWRATCMDEGVSEDQREAARVSFTARQQVAQMPEAQASADMTRRAIRDHVGLPDDDRERLGRQEANARQWVGREKNAAQKLALRHPDRCPGLRRR